MLEVRTQPGPQETFLATQADIAIYGGAAGGGKSFAMLMEPLRHVTRNREFAAVLFRRALADVKKPGGTWDQMVAMYGERGAKPSNDVLSWTWPGGRKGGDWPPGAGGLDEQRGRRPLGRRRERHGLAAGQQPWRFASTPASRHSTRG